MEKNVSLTQLNLQTFLKSTSDLYLILNTKFDIAMVSAAYAKATKINAETVIGKNIFDVFPQVQGENAITNLRSSLDRVIKNKIADTMAVQKYNIPSEQDEKVYEERYWSPLNIPILIGDKVHFIIHRVEDVTEFIKYKQMNMQEYEAQKNQMENEIFRRAQEIEESNKRLRESEERFRLFIENSKDYAFIMLDKDGYITSWNMGAERIKGYKSHEIIGQHFSIFYPSDALRKHHPAHELQISKEHGRYEEEGWRVRKNGSKFWANVVITPIYDEKGRLIAYCKVTRDLTERRKTETLKNEFVSVVSHELRTPLTSIRGSISLILGGAAGSCSEKTLHLLEIANNNCERLVHLINDILDIEKIEAGKMNFCLHTYDTADLIKNSIVDNQIYIEKYNKQVVSKLIPHVQISVDIDRFMQVLANLISNAAKFGNEGSQIKIEMKKISNGVRISVTNHGPGIPKNFQDKIFQKFSQADASSVRSQGGTGLGLSISKAIIERLGGTMGFKSTPGKETVFYFDLPSTDVKQIAMGSSTEISPSINRILICEDDEDQAVYLKELVEGAGFVGEICFTAAQTKRNLEDNVYYALLLDLVLPDMDGIQLIKELRDTARDPNIPIIIISIIANEAKSYTNGNAVQVVDWINKPVDFNKLAKAFSTISDRIKTDKPRLLHVEDDIDVQKIVINLFSDRAKIVSLTTIREAKDILHKQKFDVAIIDLLLPDGNGAEILPALAEHNIPVIVFSRDDLDPKFVQYVQEVLIKSKTSPERLLDTINQFLKPQ